MVQEMTSNVEKNFKFMHVREYGGAERSHGGLFVYEKIDGGNCSVRKEDGILVPYSRSRRLTSQDLGSFYFLNLFNWVHSVPALQHLPEDKILCGEWTHYGFGHICYNPEYMERFFLLGVYDKNEGRYLHPDKSSELVNSLDMESNVVRLPILRSGNINNEIADELVQSKSDFYDGLKEGIVIHKYHDTFKNGLRMEKYFSPEFREIDYGGKGIDKYITKRRLIKAAQNLRTHGKRLNFGNVVGAAANDILRDIKDYKREELIAAFQTPEIESLFNEKIFPLFQINRG